MSTRNLLRLVTAAMAGSRHAVTRSALVTGSAVEVLCTCPVGWCPAGVVEHTLSLQLTSACLQQGRRGECCQHQLHCECFHSFMEPKHEMPALLGWT
jgi:hypothetical protein